MHTRIPKVYTNGLPRAHRDSRLFLIACEGEKTEFQYFSFPFLVHPRVKIKVIRSDEGTSSPTYVLDNLRKLIKDVRREYDLKPSDRFWLVIDRDRWDLYEQIDKIINKRIDNKPVNVAISNPSFELFLYLHFNDLPDKPIERSSDMEALLRKTIGGYSKRNLREEDYINGYKDAVRRSLLSSYDSFGIPVNPGTDVGKILNEIQENVPKRSNQSIN